MTHHKAKRGFDLIAAGVGLLLTWPIFLLLAVGIKMDDRGPVFYRANRVGQGGELFKLYKFRTMRINADQLGPSVTYQDDPRITRVGAWLRRYKLDELPQLLNVVKGDMSLVGPRPEAPDYAALYTPEQKQILHYRPGITSAASLKFRHEQELMQAENWEEIYEQQLLPQKLTLDLDYMKQSTFWTDLNLILQTVKALFD